ATWGRAAASSDHRDWHGQGWIRYGDALARANKLTAAAEAYRKAIALGPGFPFARSRLVQLQTRMSRERVARADALGAKGDAQEAADAYKEAIEREPTVIPLYRKLGMALLRLKGDAGNDLAAGCRKAVALYPNNPYAHHALGGALYRTDRAGALA